MTHQNHRIAFILGDDRVADLERACLPLAERCVAGWCDVIKRDLD
ncbi:hypothetical protein [Streptomyces luteogriseus]